jgi:hypothetical protein
MVSPDEPISNFKLISPNDMTPGADGIRIEIPDDIELEKLSCDPYSTTNDERPIKELNPAIMIRINNNLVRHKELEKEWLDGKVQPHEFSYWVEEHDKLCVAGCPKFGLVTKKQRKFCYKHRDCIVLDHLPNDDKIDDFKLEIPVKKYENLIKKMREFIRDYHEFSDIHRRELDKYSDEKLLVEMFWVSSRYCENSLAFIEKAINKKGSDWNKKGIANQLIYKVEDDLLWDEDEVLEKYGKSASNEKTEELESDMEME